MDAQSPILELLRQPVTERDDEAVYDEPHHDVPLDADEASVCSGKSFGSQSSGTHMVDMVDPNAVDFQPLLVSENGAAMTMPLHELADDSLRNYQEFANGHTANGRFVNGHNANGSKGNSSSNPSRYLSSAKQGVILLMRRLSGSAKGFERRVRAQILAPLLWQICPAGTSSFVSDEPSLLASLAICCVLFLVVAVATAVASAMSRIPPAAQRGAQQTLRFTNPDAIAMGASLAPPPGTSLPRLFQHMSDVDDLPPGLMDTAVFWHVPRSGGTTMMQVVASCFGRVVASDIGGLEGHAIDEQLKIVGKDYGNFVNVDTTTPHGIQRAKKLGLAPSRMAGVVFSPYVHEIAGLFDGRHRGRFFTVLREPVSRIVSMYYYQKQQGTLSAQVTLEEFVKEDGENWMTRMLTNTMTGSIDARQLNVAKEMLRRKFLVGLLDEKTETLRRMEQYFGWKFPSPVAQNCKNDKLYFEWNGKTEHPELDLKDPVTLLTQKMNRYDIELYSYAKQLFKEQEALFWKASKKLTDV